MSNWVKTKNPDDIEIKGENILLFDGESIWVSFVNCRLRTGEYHVFEGNQPTHWMPLPEWPRDNVND